MNRSFWYEFKPTLYVFAGLLCTIGFDNSIGKFAGVLLIAAGVFALNLRILHRSKFSQ